MPSTGFPILFITASRIGDAVLSSGLIRRLIEEIPNARFTIVAGPVAAPLFRDTPGLDELIALEKEKRGLHWLTLTDTSGTGLALLPADLPLIGRARTDSRLGCAAA